ncbi:MAG: rhomboid family intramembrane serine protease, partial [Pseudomonadota bacterium]
MSHIPKIPDQDRPSPFARRVEPLRPPEPPRPAREPMFTMPTSVIVLIAIFGIIHLYRSTLNRFEDVDILAMFAFIPARYSGDWSMLPGGIAADVWTFVTYAFLHGSTMHIVTNAIWMLAFGSAVARRFGAWRFFAFSALCAAGGAAAHLAV